ncbi:MAG: HlyD family efflux transporter periplasmic adaptor subunit [Cyclobacteriaceae bacterium]|nr:HlyD family efflux transporter periplasmic adaptor subunit [Cyclobacteriaceae bacterium]
MKKYNVFNSLLIIAISGFLYSCEEDTNTSDAFGNFDVNETIISAEVAGVLENFKIEEGMKLTAGEVVGSIDSTNLILERNSIQANKYSVGAKLTAINAEIKVLKTQLAVIQKERQRVIKLIKSDAATQKQLDDIEGNINIIKAKITAANAQKPSATAQLEVIEANIAKINNQISNCTIINPVEGTVLTKLVETHELVGLGKPLYKVANPANLYLKAYVTGTQVSGLKIGQKVTIIIDNTGGDYTDLEGVINWVSEEAEFTPKLIQTRKERVSLVYAIKVGFNNPGVVKIGMPGEVKF